MRNRSRAKKKHDRYRMMSYLGRALAESGLIQARADAVLYRSVMWDYLTKWTMETPKLEGAALLPIETV